MDCSSLGTKETTHEFWKERVAPTFNDEGFQPFGDFSYVLPGIQVQKHPFAPKTAEHPWNLVYDIRSGFAVIYSIFCDPFRWKAVQSDPGALC